MIRKYLLSTCLGLSLVTSLAITAQAAKDSPTDAVATDEQSTPTKPGAYTAAVSAFDATSGIAEKTKELIDAVMTDRKNHGYVYHAATYPENYKKVIDSAKKQSLGVQKKVVEKLTELSKDKKYNVYPKVRDMLTHAEHLANAPVVEAKGYESPKGGLADTSSTKLLKEDEAMAEAKTVISKVLPSTKQKEFYSKYYEEILAAADKEKNPQIKAAIIACAASTYHTTPMLKSVDSKHESGVLYAWSGSTFRWNPASQKAQDHLKEVFKVELEGGDKTDGDSVASAHYQNNPDKNKFEDDAVNDVIDSHKQSEGNISHLKEQFTASLSHLKDMIAAMEKHFEENHFDAKFQTQPKLMAINDIISKITLIRPSAGLDTNLDANAILLEDIKTNLKDLPEDKGEDGHKSHFLEQCDTLAKITQELKDHSTHHTMVHNKKVDEISEILPHKADKIRGATDPYASTIDAPMAPTKAALSTSSTNEDDVEDEYSDPKKK